MSLANQSISSVSPATAGTASDYTPSAPLPDALTLADLPLDQPGRIHAVHGSRPFRRRLMELGLVPGTEVRVINVAPLGDPLEIEVRHCRLSIRRAESRMLTIAAPAASHPRKVAS